LKYRLSIDLKNIRNQLKQYYGEAVAIAFEKRLAFIKNAKNEIDFYAMRSLKYEEYKEKKLKGLHSIRINDSYRLLFKYETIGGERTIVLLEIRNDIH